MIKYSPSASCYIDNVTGINDIVKPCLMKITSRSSFNNICINKLLLPTNAFDNVNNSHFLYQHRGYKWYWKIKFIWFEIYRQVFYYTLWKYTPLCVFYMPQDSRTSCQLLPPCIIDKHTRPFGINNLKCQYYLNHLMQLLLPILRTICYNFQFDSNAERSLSKCLFKTAHSACNSTDVDAPIWSNSTR